MRDQPFPHQVLENWPEQGIKKGDYCMVQRGKASIGKLIWLTALEQEACSLLLSVDEFETITIQGNDNQIVRLTRFEYEIEGEVVRIESRLLSLVSTSFHPGKTWDWTADQFGIVKPCVEWSKLTGHPPEAVRDFLPLVHPDDRERNANEWMEAQRAKKMFSLQNRMRTESGDYVSLLNLAIPVLDQAGSITSWFGATQII